MADQAQRILLAVDGSDNALEAVRYASKVRRVHKTEIVLFNVFSKVPNSYWDMENQPLFGKKIAGIRAWEMQNEKEIKEYMGKATQILLDAGVNKEDVTVNIHERDEGVARDIMKEAEKGYDAVVIGRGGMSKFKDLIIGSVAIKLLEKCDFIPLFVVGKSAEQGKVLVGYDGSDGAVKAVDYVCDTLGGTDFEVGLINVIRGEEGSFLKDAEIANRNLLNMAKSRLLTAGFKSNQITTKIITGASNRAGAIIQEAEEGCYGTVVVGRRGLSKVHEFFMGRVSNQVVQMVREHVVCVVS